MGQNPHWHLWEQAYRSQLRKHPRRIRSRVGAVASGRATEGSTAAFQGSAEATGQAGSTRPSRYTHLDAHSPGPTACNGAGCTP